MRKKEGRKCFIYRRTQHILFTVIWRQTYCKGPDSDMHHLTDRMTHATGFVTPVVEHWLKRKIAQWAHHEGLIRRPIAP